MTTEAERQTHSEYRLEGSKSVSKVQELPNVSVWNDHNAILRDYLKCYFSKKTAILRRKHQMSARKRVIIITIDDILLVYETNCTGYIFPISQAIRINTSCNGNVPELMQEKICTITLKYKFGWVNLQLQQHQISIWRRTLWSIFDGESFDESLASDISVYTATAGDEDDDDLTFYEEDLKSVRSNRFEYTDSVYSLKSVPACMNLSPDQMDPCELDVSQEAMVQTSKTNSNRSLTYIPEQIPSSRKGLRKSSASSSVKKSNSQNGKLEGYSFGTRSCVSFLAKRFEDKWKESLRKKFTKEQDLSKRAESPPLEVLFPPIPVKRCEPKDSYSTIEEQRDNLVSTLQYTPKKTLPIIDDCL